MVRLHEFITLNKPTKITRRRKAWLTVAHQNFKMIMPGNMFEKYGRIQGDYEAKWTISWSVQCLTHLAGQLWQPEKQRKGNRNINCAYQIFIHLFLECSCDVGATVWPNGHEEKQISRKAATIIYNFLCIYVHYIC